MNHDFPLNLNEVLGVSSDAKLADIRTAYIEKSKKHHPDHGGDEWAFRVVQAAYERLSRSRVISHAGAETAPPSPARRADSQRSAAREAPPPAREVVEQVRAGVTDRNIDPTLVVEVELFCLRFEVANSWTTINMISAAQRNLSCSLNISWPAKELDHLALLTANVEDSLEEISAAFSVLSKGKSADAVRSKVENDRFEGWAGYSTANEAFESFRVFHEELKNRGYGVKQWSRELILPQEWK